MFLKAPPSSDHEGSVPSLTMSGMSPEHSDSETGNVESDTLSNQVKEDLEFEGSQAYLARVARIKKKGFKNHRICKIAR